MLPRSKILKLCGLGRCGCEYCAYAEGRIGYWMTRGGTWTPPEPLQTPNTGQLVALRVAADSRKALWTGMWYKITTKHWVSKELAG